MSEHLLQHHGIILSVFWFNHCWELLEIWSSVPIVLKRSWVCAVVGESEASNAHDIDRISTEKSKSCSHRMNIWPLINPSLNRNNWYSSLAVLSSSAHKDGYRPCHSSADAEVPEPLRSPLMMQLLLVLVGPPLWSSHFPLEMEFEPGIRANVVLEPVKKS